MGRPRLVHLTSIDDLRAAAPAWDDLWWRSGVTIPTLRAELLAEWVEQFAPQAEFHALVVEDDRQWVAALPLVRRLLGRVIEAGVTPTNQWSSRGELLLDAGADVDAVLDALVAALGGLPWQWLWLEDIALYAPCWQALRRAMIRAEMAIDDHPRFQVGLIEIGRDWEAYRKRWSRKHRQQMSRHSRRLAREGGVRFRIYSQLAPEEVEARMRRGFEVEDRSWKGEAGTSVLRRPAMFPFFVRQGEQLARWGQLVLSFLEVRGRPIAFAYGMHAKGVYHSCKGGYDPEYAAFSPGQLLRLNMLEAFHADPEYRAMDCMGSMTDAHRRWKPTPYAIGRAVVAPRRLLGRIALHAYKHLWSHLRRLRRGKTSQRPDKRGGGEPLQHARAGCSVTTTERRP